MSEVSGAPSDGASEVTPIDQTAETGTAPVESVDRAPAKNAREAVQRAMVEAGVKEAPETKPEVKPDATGKLRAADGKFAADPAKEPEKPKRPPPSRFAKEAHEHWNTTPEPIQAEIDRAIAELTQGIEKHKGEFERVNKEYDPFAQTIKQHETTLKQLGVTPQQAFTEAMRLHEFYNRDAVGLISHLAQQKGIDLRPYWQWLQQQGQMPVQQPQQPPQQLFEQYVAPLQQQIEELKMAPLNAEIAKFAAEKPLFKYLEQTMLQIIPEIQGAPAERLQKAYDMALAQTPELKSLLDAQAAAQAATAKAQDDPKRPDPAQTRQKAALSLTGSPSGGSNPSAKPSGSARESIKRAIAQVGL
jgi:hypothetical protein